MEHCGLLAQVSKAGLTNVSSCGYDSTNLSAKSGKCRKQQLSQILPDIPYQTSMKPPAKKVPNPLRRLNLLMKVNKDDKEVTKHCVSNDHSVTPSSSASPVMESPILCSWITGAVSDLDIIANVPMFSYNHQRGQGGWERVTHNETLLHVKPV